MTRTGGWAALRRTLTAERAGTAAATLMLAAALLAWAVITPGMRGPDEANHIGVVVELVETGAYPAPGTEPMPAGVRSSYPWFGFPGAENVFPSPGPVGALPGGAPSWSDLRDSHTPVDASLLNQISQHPPLYYLALAGTVHLLGLADAPVTHAVLIMRLMSAAVLLPVPALIASTCRRLRLPPTAVVVSAFLPAAWVQFVHINALVGNGSLLALASTVALAMIVRVLTGDLRIRTAVILGAALAVALWTKGYALALLPIAVFAYAWRWRTDRRLVWTPMIVGAAIATLGLFWYVGSLIESGTPQPTAGPAKDIRWDAAALAPWPGVFARELSGSMWLNLGSLETPLTPAALHLTASVAAVLLAGVGAWRLRARPGVVIALVAAVTLTLLIFAVGSARHWLWDGTIRGAQGRYLHGAVLAFGVLFAAGAPRARWVTVLAPTAAAAVVVAGAGFGVRHFWEGASLGLAAQAWPAGAILLTLSAALLVAGVGVGTLAAARLPSDRALS